MHVRETTPGASGAVYVLVQRGAPEPEGGWASLADALVAEHDLAAPTVIEVPAALDLHLVHDPPSGA